MHILVSLCAAVTFGQPQPPPATQPHTLPPLAPTPPHLPPLPHRPPSRHHLHLQRRRRRRRLSLQSVRPLPAIFIVLCTELHFSPLFGWFIFMAPYRARTALHSAFGVSHESLSSCAICWAHTHHKRIAWPHPWFFLDPRFCSFSFSLALTLMRFFEVNPL